MLNYKPPWQEAYVETAKYFLKRTESQSWAVQYLSHAGVINQGLNQTCLLGYCIVAIITESNIDERQTAGMPVEDHSFSDTGSNFLTGINVHISSLTKAHLEAKIIMQIRPPTKADRVRGV